MKKLIFIFLLCLGGVPFLRAEVISDYHVVVEVRQSGSLYVTETITYDFQNARKHGIYRDIPVMVKGAGRSKDIGIGNVTIQMDGKSIAWEESILLSDAGKMRRFKIGSSSYTVTGLHTYTIGYSVEMGVLPSSLTPDLDAVRWNVFGTGWEVPVLKSRSDFYLPSSLGRSDVTVRTFAGRYGSSEPGNAPEWIDDHHFQISQPRLSAHEGLTVEVNYPIGTLDQIGSQNISVTLSERLLSNWHWPVMFIFFLYLYRYLSRQSGFIDKRSVAVQYMAPEGLNVLQSGLIYDKFADNDDFSAAVLELGQKGYLEIYHEEAKDNPRLKRTSKNTAGLSEDMQYLMDRLLFKGTSSTHELKQHSAAEASNLRKGFETINEKLYDWSVQKGYMQSNPANVRKKFLIKSILAFLPVIALTVYTMIILYGAEQIMLLIFPVVFISVGLSITLTRGVFQKIFGLVFALFGTIPLFIMTESGVSLGSLLTSPLLAAVSIPIAIVYVYKRLGAYTQKGAYTYKHLLGFKAFMERVKEDELRRRLKEEPLYLEKALPYAVLFGITKHWLAFYKNLGVDYPLWYHGSHVGLDNLTDSMNSAITPPSSSSGGSSGGGGFSGGGGGGGGGGSW